MSQHKNLPSAVWAAIVGGVVFAIMMGLGGMLPMVAGLVGSESPVVGFIVHIIISIILGAIYLFIFAKPTNGKVVLGTILGSIYGVVWWVLGPLLIMPSIMGMGPQFTAEGVAMAMPSFWGHLVFGFLLGHIYSLMTE